MKKSANSGIVTFLILCLLCGAIINVLWVAATQSPSYLLERAQYEADILHSTGAVVVSPAMNVAREIGKWRDSKAMRGKIKPIFYATSAVQIIILRSAQIIIYLPTVLLFLFLGFIDGWVEKRRRSMNYSLEAAATRYVLWRKFLVAPLIIALSLALFWPVAINVAVLVLPAAFLSALFLRQTIALYK